MAMAADLVSSSTSKTRDLVRHVAGDYYSGMAWLLVIYLAARQDRDAVVSLMDEVLTLGETLPMLLIGHDAAALQLVTLLYSIDLPSYADKLNELCQLDNELGEIQQLLEGFDKLEIAGDLDAIGF